MLLNTNWSNWRSAVQRYFPLRSKRVFSGERNVVSQGKTVQRAFEALEEVNNFEIVMSKHFLNRRQVALQRSTLVHFQRENRIISVTRFGKFSTLWQNLKNVWAWGGFSKYLAKSFTNFGKFVMPNIEKII